MSLTSDLNAIKTVQDGVKNNKVTRFAYTANAYANNDVDGHSDYVATRDNNIPLSDLSVIEVNQTVVDKGFRARASALNRMFLNHLFGRVSYNLNKINDLFNDLLVKVVANLGVPNGLATLDANGRIPYTQLPEDAMEYQGDWNAQTNTPTLADGTGTKGDTYNVSVGGTQDLGSGDIVFFAGDRVIYNGSVWQRASGGNILTVSEIAPSESNGNVDLSKQTDVKKILNSNFLNKIYSLFSAKGWVKMSDVGTPLASAEDNGTYYVVSTSGIYSSIDRVHWTKEYTVTDNLKSTRVAIAVADGIVAVVCCALTNISNGLVAIVKSSSSDDTFRRQVVTASGTSDDIAVPFIANGVLMIAVAGGNSNASLGLWRSTDYGVTFTHVISTGQVFRPTYQNGLCHVRSQSLGFAYSEDFGATWTVCTYNPSSLNKSPYTPVLYANGIWLVGCQSGGQLPLWSSDGKTWQQGTGDTLVSSGIAKIAYVNNLWFAIEDAVSASGSDPTRLGFCSEDGKVWTPCTVSTPVASGNQGLLWYTSNIIYEKGIYLINVNRRETGLSLYYSYDAIHWYHVNSPSSITATFMVYWVTYGDGVFTCITQRTASNEKMYKSLDGITWEEVTVPDTATTATAPAQVSVGTMFNYKDDFWLDSSQSIIAPSGEKYINGEQE